MTVGVDKARQQNATRAVDMFVIVPRKGSAAQRRNFFAVGEQIPVLLDRVVFIHRQHSDIVN